MLIQVTLDAGLMKPRKGFTSIVGKEKMREIVKSLTVHPYECTLTVEEMGLTG